MRQKVISFLSCELYEVNKISCKHYPHVLMFTLKTYKHLYIVHKFNMYARVHIIFSVHGYMSTSCYCLHTGNFYCLSNNNIASSLALSAISMYGFMAE